MLNLKKEAESLKQEEFRLGECPVCKAYVCHQYFMRDATTKKASKWYSCACGIVFQDKKPQPVYDKKYWDKYNDRSNKIAPMYEYPCRIYLPIIEELIYGRRVLMIGKQTPHQEQFLSKRGWVPTSIDPNPASGAHIISNFESHKFPESQKYNMIWMYHTLECFLDPIASLELCSNLLTEDGIFFIGTPDTDFINTRSSSNFMHWNPDENYLMWNRRSLTRHLENRGFNVILSRQNVEPRFPVRDDLHLIAQKKFF